MNKSASARSRLSGLFARSGVVLGLLRLGSRGPRRVLAVVNTAFWRSCLKGLGSRSNIELGVQIESPAQVSFGARAFVTSGAILSSETVDGLLRAGNGVQVNRRAFLDHTGGLEIGDDVLISEDAIVYTHDHGHDPRSRPTPTPLRVGHSVWIGARAIVLPGVREIGDGALIGAGAVVSKPVPPGAVVVGNPARTLSRSRKRPTASRGAA